MKIRKNKRQRALKNFSQFRLHFRNWIKAQIQFRRRITLTIESARWIDHKSDSLEVLSVEHLSQRGSWV